MSETENESVEHLELLVANDADDDLELNGQGHDEALGMADWGGDDEDEELGDVEAILHHAGGAPTPDPSDPGGDDSDGDIEDLDRPNLGGVPINDDDIVLPVWHGECNVTCRPPWEHLFKVYRYYQFMFDAKRDTILEQEKEIRRLRRDLRDRDELIRRLRFGNRKTEPTYPGVVTNWVEGNHHMLPQGIRTWEDVYKLTCRETNMSPHPTKTHPDLLLRTPNEDEEEAEDEKAAEDEEDAEDADGLEPGAGNELVEMQGIFPFDQLDSNLQVEILRMVLVFDGQVVHAISRLDPYCEPTVVPLNCRGEISPLHRFHVGKSKVNVTFAQKPEDLLAPLLVSKRWNYIGANLFYSGNKFCFSSLGE
ncbi:hypothetical protein BKA56DRAFT_672856 [Ilyonectria sp. MPI-CAGE-AT-0026]|nr:hypothetical protein BKA56DRAFT_672856 [Ilyonectria sp. MPI-CAGE-AT-0026]